jgi:nicotinamidase-related amidase
VTLLQPERTALLVIDLQERLLPAIQDHARVVHNSVALLRLARILELHVVLTTQYQRGLGATVPEVLAEAPGVEPLDKSSFGCFGDAPFRARLQALGRKQLVVCGVETHICVAQTVLGAIDAGYEVHVAGDATGTRSPMNHDVGLRRMERAGAVMSSTEMAIYELLGRSDTAAFKRMLPFIKEQV